MHSNSNCYWKQNKWKSTSSRYSTILSPGSEYFIVVFIPGAYFPVPSSCRSCTSQLVKHISHFPVHQGSLDVIAELETREVKCEGSHSISHPRWQRIKLQGLGKRPLIPVHKKDYSFLPVHKLYFTFHSLAAWKACQLADSLHTRPTFFCLQSA